MLQQQNAIAAIMIEMWSSRVTMSVCSILAVYKSTESRNFVCFSTSLARVATASDAMWLSSTYAIEAGAGAAHGRELNITTMGRSCISINTCGN
jgi:hypothetical protein